MNDLMSALTAARPTERELDTMWAPTDREALRTRLLTAETEPIGPRRGRRTAVLAAAASVAAAAVVVPTALGGESAAAADLRVLALNAASYDGPVLAEGTWLHEQSSSLQVNHASPGSGRSGEVYDHDRESWTSWDGRTVYVVDTTNPQGTTEYDVLRSRAEPSYADPTPAYAATLPSHADGLLAYLDNRVEGSSSHQEALFEALIGLIDSHTLPPATLAAAFTALAEVDDVATSDVLVGGEQAVEITFTEASTSSSETLVVDRSTGQALSTIHDSDHATYTSTTSRSEVVDEVPTDVRDRAR